MYSSFPALFGVAALLAASALPAQAQEQSFQLTIKNHRFEPAEFEVPANTKVKLLVKNEDATAEEFESSSLHREKAVPPGKEITVLIGPLKPGRYEFIGDFNRATAHGAIIVK
jgi:plastocyanin